MGVGDQARLSPWHGRGADVLEVLPFSTSQVKREVKKHTWITRMVTNPPKPTGVWP